MPDQEKTPKMILLDTSNLEEIEGALALLNTEDGITAYRYALLTFPLPENQYDFELAYRGADFAFAWDEIRNQIRDELKYNPNISEEYSKALRWVQKIMYDLVTEKNLPTF
jgi:hypothetical protein